MLIRGEKNVRNTGNNLEILVLSYISGKNVKRLNHSSNLFEGIGLGSKESTCNVGNLSLIFGSGRGPGGGHGNPLQHSCLKNPGQRSWLATVLRVAKSQKWLKQLSTQKHSTYKTMLHLQYDPGVVFSRIYPREMETHFTSKLIWILRATFL